MSWYSIYGTGATIHNVQHADGDRVEFTSWFSVIWIPLIPLRSWSAIYLGETLPNGITDEGHLFADLRRIPHNGRGLLQTFSCGLIVTTIAIAPEAVLIYCIDGRAATPIEMVLAFAFAIWVMALILLPQKRRKDRLVKKKRDQTTSSKK